MYPDEQKMFPAHHHPDFLGNGAPAPGAEGNGLGGLLQPQPQPYRPFEHLPPAQPAPAVIPGAAAAAQPPAGPPSGSGTKSANWKSNEARRPKTYNCTACNKWFTSSGHLKRHYNTTLHKNAVKSSGQPDPATLPISAHHHPARESSNRDDSSGSPGEDSRLPAADDAGGGLPFERTAAMPGLLQQPPNGPYDRQPPNIHHTPPLHSPMPGLAAALPNGGSPNGEAGPSPTTSLDSRGLLLTSTPGSAASQPQQPPPPPMHGFNMASPMMAMEGAQFQIYPNELAPHVTQAMDISSLSTTGEFHQQELTPDASDVQQQPLQPLPSFAQFLIQRTGVLIGSADDANVGGGGAATAPFNPFYTERYIANMPDLRTLAQLGVRVEQDIADYAPVDQAALCAADELIIGYPESSPEYIQASPEYVDASPIYHQTTPEYAQTSPIYQQTSPVYPQTSPVYPQTSPDSLVILHNNNNTTKKNNNNDRELDDSLTSEGDSQLSIMEDTSPEKAVARRSPKLRFKRDFEESARVISPSSLLGAQSDQHKCFECDKKFNKPCYLTQHNKTFHSGDKPFKCQTCGKRFATEPEYSKHQKKHNGEKPHKCELCTKQFNHKTDLRRHMCLHTGLKPFACKTCGKGFIRKDHMHKHEETHLRKNKRV